jgi:hypothetical protein
MPSPTASGPHAFLDTLIAPNQASGWEDRAGCDTFQADGFHFTNANICTAPDPSAPFANGTVSVIAKQISGPVTQGYSLVFRANLDSPSFYAFLIDSNGSWRALKVVANQPTFLGSWTSTAAIHKGLNASNTMQVLMSGSHFEFSVNGTRVGQADDSTLATGYAGLWGNTGIEVVYTSFKEQVGE